MLCCSGCSFLLIVFVFRVCLLLFIVCTRLFTPYLFLGGINHGAPRGGEYCLFFVMAVDDEFSFLKATIFWIIHMIW